MDFEERQEKCRNFKARCGGEDEYQLSGKDWCEIRPEFYLGPNELYQGQRECHDLDFLIANFDAQLNTNVDGLPTPKYPHDPYTRRPIPMDRLITLAAHYVVNGGVLPIALGTLLYIVSIGRLDIDELELTDPEDLAHLEGAQGLLIYHLRPQIMAQVDRDDLEDTLVESDSDTFSQASGIIMDDNEVDNDYELFQIARLISLMLHTNPALRGTNLPGFDLMDELDRLELYTTLDDRANYVSNIVKRLMGREDLPSSVQQWIRTTLELDLLDPDTLSAFTDWLEEVVSEVYRGQMDEVIDPLQRDYIIGGLLQQALEHLRPELVMETDEGLHRYMDQVIDNIHGIDEQHLEQLRENLFYSLLRKVQLYY